LGSRLVAEGEEHSRFLLARSFAIGSVLLIVATWCRFLAASCGRLPCYRLGATALAFVSATQGESAAAADRGGAADAAGDPSALPMSCEAPAPAATTLPAGVVHRPAGGVRLDAILVSI
jgi:hypothetical protein